MPPKKTPQAKASEKDSSKPATNPDKVKAKKESSQQVQNDESEKDKEIKALLLRVDCLEKNMNLKVFQTPSGFSIAEGDQLARWQGAFKSAEKELIMLKKGLPSSGNGNVPGRTDELTEKIATLEKEISTKDIAIAGIKTELDKANSALDEMRKQLSDNSDSKSYAKLQEEMRKKHESIAQLNKELQLIRQPTDGNTSATLAALEASMQSKESEIKNLKEKITRLESAAISDKQSNAQLQEAILKKDQSSIEKLNKELQSIRNELEEKGFEIKRVQEEKKSQLQRLQEENDAALKRLKEQKDNEERSKQMWMDKVKDLENNTERSKSAKARSDSLQTLLKEKETEIRSKTGEIESLQQEMAGLKKSYNVALTHCITLEGKIKATEEDYKKKLVKKDETIRGEKTMEKTAPSGRDEVGVLKQQLTQATLEIDELKSRPDIQDLSDSNRPSKLAERFSELYDDEWTNCYDTARKQFSTEQSAVQMLLRTCVKIYYSCSLNASKDVHDLQRAFSTFSEAQDDILLIQIKQRRKRTRQVDIDLKRITPGIGDSVADMLGPDLIKNQHVRAFWVKCLEICWLLVIQEPPVYMDTEINKQGQMFDHAAYRPYTQTGYEFDYVVWPALYTHQGGDILYKGVAQGRDSSDSVGGKRRSSLVKK